MKILYKIKIIVQCFKETYYMAKAEIQLYESTENYSKDNISYFNEKKYLFELTKRRRYTSKYASKAFTFTGYYREVLKSMMKAFTINMEDLNKHGYHSLAYENRYSYVDTLRVILNEQEELIK